MKQPNTTSFAHGVIVDADGAITLGHNVSLDDDAQFHSRSLLTIAQDVVINSSNHSINMTSADMQLDGNITTGIGAVKIDCGKPGSIMAIGEDLQGDLRITGESLCFSLGSLTAVVQERRCSGSRPGICS